MNETKKIPVVALLLAGLATLPAMAQSSAGYRLEEHVFNAGGHPDNGTVMSSASFSIKLDAIGEGVVGTALGSASYRMDSGFGGAYPPPGEVQGLWFADHDHLHWDPEKSVGAYNLYRGPMSDLPGLGYGDCTDAGLTDTTATDSAWPSTSDGWFYLVTAENRLGEEGTKGSDSGGIGRANPSPCP